MTEHEAWQRTLHPISDEIEFTPWAEEGWHAYNGQSPEVEVCNFAASLVRLAKPQLVIETGVGQGYMTRALVSALTPDQALLSFESDDEWREMIASQPFWANNPQAALDPRPTPIRQQLRLADLCVFDSDFLVRLKEIETWHGYGKPGSLALIHDTGERHDDTTLHQVMNKKIHSLGMQGVFLHNPRGSFLAIKPA